MTQPGETFSQKEQDLPDLDDRVTEWELEEIRDKTFQLGETYYLLKWKAGLLSTTSERIFSLIYQKADRPTMQLESDCDK